MYRWARYWPPNGTSTVPRPRGGIRPRWPCAHRQGWRGLCHGGLGPLCLLVCCLADGRLHLLLCRPLAQEGDGHRGQCAERRAEEEPERPGELRAAVQGPGHDERGKASGEAAAQGLERVDRPVVDR